MLKGITIFLTLVVLASCAGSVRDGAEGGSQDSLVTQSDKKNETPFLPLVVDSFEVVYYKKPFTDSTRYYRFFRFAKISDSSFITELKQVLAGTYDRLPEVKKCLSEGKLIIPLGGEGYRTIYFSRLETRCPYFYYIKDGAFYYYELSNGLNDKLNVLETLAVEPK